MRWVVVVIAAFLVSVGLAAIVTFPLGGGDATGRDELEPLPELAQVPDWSLTASTGETVTSDDLRGTPYIADFIFTRCKLACPMMTMDMKSVQDALAARGVLGEVKLVSVSVDPEHDRPDVLAEFKRRYEAHAEHWLFLTGESREEVWSLVEDGYLLPLDEDPDNELMPIQHSTRFVLVDAEGAIRGYFSADSEEGRRELVEAALRLQAASPR